jgi:hypothetical protein
MRLLVVFTSDWIASEALKFNVTAFAIIMESAPS